MTSVSSETLNVLNMVVVIGVAVTILTTVFVVSIGVWGLVALPIFYLLGSYFVIRAVLNSSMKLSRQVLQEEVMEITGDDLELAQETTGEFATRDAESAPEQRTHSEGSTIGLQVVSAVILIILGGSLGLANAPGNEGTLSFVVGSIVTALLILGYKFDRLPIN